ncbi:unnamed protein product [Rhizoctonia solani]|uniref:Thioester reductase (TE) domain-containing protein n=1 Tax=Rhizoctonia solani TaxID=456999 RepID=A0A8H3ACY3_9AGAM|nr:unnamed protein product [Rhizoctonia solani]
MVKKYDSRWPRQPICSIQLVQKERVIVTGTTGGLGAHLLWQLLGSDRIERVWAMNRTSAKGSVRERMFATFEDKLLDANLLKSDKLVLVDVDLEIPNLGLCDELYEEASSREIFLCRLQSFEPSIRGARNLLDLALNSTAPTGSPRFVFTSSIAVAGGFTRSGTYLKEVPVSLEGAATSIGYAQSKLVTEKLLESAKGAGLQIFIVRLGQLAGDIKSGSWSITDWVPSLIRSSTSVGCLPEANGNISWLPLDVAARSIIDVCTAREAELPSVVHISHPRPIPWVAMLCAFSAYIGSRTGSQLPIVSFEKWNKRVFEAAASFKGSENDRYERFPSTKIQAMVDDIALANNELRSRGDTSDAEFGGNPRLDTTTAEAIGKTLRTTPELGAEHV